MARKIIKISIKSKLEKFHSSTDEIFIDRIKFFFIVLTFFLEEGQVLAFI